MVERIFNAPMPAGYLQKSFRRRRPGGKAGYPVGGLPARIALPREAENLLRLRPFAQIAAQQGCGFKNPAFEASVSFFDGLVPLYCFYPFQLFLRGKKAA